MNRQRYFAYGSNLDLQDWHRWCGERGFREGLLRPLFKAWLPDRCLAFTRWSGVRQSGVLDIPPARGHLVEGFVFEVDGDGWDALAQKEGSPKAYCPLDTEALTVDGTAHSVRTFEVVPGRRQRFVAPNEAYVKIVRAGCRAFGLAEAALDAAAADAPAPSSLAGVFVYGTLMRGQSRSGVLAAVPGTSVVAGRVPGQLFDLGAFPGLRPDPGSEARVVGELHRPIDGPILEVLDRIEGFPGFDVPGGLFRRRILAVETADHRAERAWAYALAVDREYPRIETGAWQA